MKKKRIILTVINDLNYDQRMIRICTALAQAGYDVLLVGRQYKGSKPLQPRPFAQYRIGVRPQQGKLMYLTYWIKLFFYLLARKADALCAIDLDTILPVYWTSVLKKTKRVYDAHEIFTELQEVTSRPLIKKLWERIGNFAIPKFTYGYTIGECYRDFFKDKYGVTYALVRNATILQPLVIPEKKERIILYQGWVNVGRCFEYLIPAMKDVAARLIICGEGNFYKEARELVGKYGLQDKIIFEGYIPPEQLKAYTLKAWIGITLFEFKGLSNLYSMANRFFDYMHAGVPQLCNAYPEYIRVNEQYQVAQLLEEISPEAIARGLNQLLADQAYHEHLVRNTLEARNHYNWQNEEKRLLQVYEKLFSTDR